MRSGGSILVDQLVVQGVSTVFTVPGESFLPVLDALRDTPAIATIVCRHEGGAAMMAEAAARLTGQRALRPQVALVTRAPGAANAMSGVVCAAASAAPLLLIVGLTRSDFAGRDAFQDIDVAAVFASLAKWTGVCRDAGRIPDYVARACHAALSGRPGPVVLGIPEDVLAALADVADAPRYTATLPPPSAEAIGRLGDALRQAQRPLLIVGGPGWSDAASTGLEAIATHLDLPVAAAFRCQDAFDNRHPCYVGHAGLATAPKLAAGIRAADLLILAGCRADEITTGGWSLIATPAPTQRIAMLAREPAETGRDVRSDITLLGDPDGFVGVLGALLAPSVVSPSLPDTPPAWAAWRRDLRAAFEASRATPAASATDQPARPPWPLAHMMRHLSERLPDDSIVCSGAGNYAAILHRYFLHKESGTSLAPLSGSMGYGLPAAIAAKLANPARTVVAIAGDGCFMMTAQELATAAQYGLALLVIVVDNGLYGTIRLHQERRYPGRAFATRLVNPDFAALFASFGGHAARVATPEAFASALDDALARDGLRLIAITTGPDDIAPPAW